MHSVIEMFSYISFYSYQNIYAFHQFHFIIIFYSMLFHLCCFCHPSYAIGMTINIFSVHLANCLVWSECERCINREGIKKNRSSPGKIQVSRSVYSCQLREQGWNLVEEEQRSRIAVVSYINSLQHFILYIIVIYNYIYIIYINNIYINKKRKREEDLMI